MRLQQKLVGILQRANSRTFTFEEVGVPTVPDCTVIFEIGVADSEGFTFIDRDETEKILRDLRKTPFGIMDFFCGVRYYREYAGKKKPLKFDYFISRFIFNAGSIELQVFHERGPRYLSPNDIISFFMDRINETTARKILKKRTG